MAFRRTIPSSKALEYLFRSRRHYVHPSLPHVRKDKVYWSNRKVNLGVGDTEEEGGSYGPYESLVRSDGAIAYYKFDDCPDFVVSDTDATEGYGVNTGTYKAVMQGEQSPLCEDSTFGVLTTVGATVVPDLFNQSNDWSFECWMNPTGAGSGFQYLCFKGPSAGNFGVLFLDNALGSDHAIALLEDGAVRLVTDDDTIVDTNTHHVVVTYEGTGDTITIYINGVQEAQGTYAIAATSDDISIGAQFTTSRSGEFKGTMDFVSFYDFELSAAQVLVHYNTGSL